MERIVRYPASFPDLVLLIGGSEFAFKSCVVFGAFQFQCNVNEMTIDAPKINGLFKGKFGTFDLKDEVCSHNPT